MRTSKRLSVIIPGYQTPENYWRRCLSSVLSNVGMDDEVICVDDGSATKPIFLQRDYAAKDPRVHVLFLEKNVGLPSARNAAMNVANGEYLTFVDSDDELLPGVYERAIEAHAKSRSDIVVFGVCAIWVAERLMMSCIPHHIESRALTAEDIRKLYDGRVFNYAWNKVYRRSFLEGHHLRFEPDGVPCEDVIFILRCCISGAKWISLESEGINYFRTHGSLLSRYKPTYLKGSRLALAAWESYRSNAKDGCVDLGEIGIESELDLIRGEWDNIWRLNTPFSVRERLSFAKAHPELYKGWAYFFFIKKLLFSILRRWLYFPFVQRWHIKRIYDGVQDCAEVG